MPAEGVRLEVNARYRRNYPRTPGGWPGISAVQKTLHDVRLKRLPNPKDEPWSLYTLAEHDIPADALQFVLDAYAMAIASSSEPLTVRAAQWVARLHRVIADTEELTIVAKLCAENERINEITGKPLPGLVDADFETRATTGKPGVSYKYQGKGDFQMVIHDSRMTESLDFRLLPKRLIKRDKRQQRGA
jgi:hypothetical protein